MLSCDLQGTVIAMIWVSLILTQTKPNLPGRRVPICHSGCSLAVDVQLQSSELRNTSNKFAHRGTLRCNSAIHISRWKMRKMLWSIQIRVLWFEGKKWNRQHGSSTTSPIRNLTILGFATDMKTKRKQFESCTGPKVSIRATPSPFPNLQWDLLKLPKSIRLQDFALEIVKTLFGSQLSKKKTSKLDSLCSIRFILITCLESFIWFFFKEINLRTW